MTTRLVVLPASMEYARAVYLKYEFSYFSGTSQQISNDGVNYASEDDVE
jgi:hypothetical protein